MSLEESPSKTLFVQDCTTCKHSTDNGGRAMGCDECDSETFDGWEMKDGPNSPETARTLG